MDWDRAGVERRGFTGFVRFAEVDNTDVPRDPGVYVALRERAGTPTFLPTSPAGHFKGRNPSAEEEDLRAAWAEGATVVYIGKAAGGINGRRGLRTRLREYQKHGAGQPVGH
jgi:hypothetical protein